MEAGIVRTRLGYPLEFVAAIDEVVALVASGAVSIHLTLRVMKVRPPPSLLGHPGPTGDTAASSCIRCSVLRMRVGPQRECKPACQGGGRRRSVGGRGWQK